LAFEDVRSVIEYLSGASKISSKLNKDALKYINQVKVNKISFGRPFLAFLNFKVLNAKLSRNNFKEFFYFLIYAEEYELEEEIAKYDATEVKASVLEDGSNLSL